jgi:MFS family permease
VSKLAVLMITAFVDMVGLLMVIPLLPFFAEDLGGGGLWVGILVSAFSFAQLVSAPLWGRVSDRYGRRPALLVGLGAAAISYVVFAYASSLWLLLLSRLVQGAGGGTVGVVQAYVADATEPKDRAKSLGWLSAATNAGVAIGPVMGSASLGFGRATPGLLAAGLCLVNMAFAWMFLTESHVGSARDGSARRPARSREMLRHVMANPTQPAPRLIWIYAVGMGAFAGFTSTLALFLSHHFEVTEQSIGYVFMWTGVVSVIIRALLLGRMVDALGEARLARLGQMLLGAGLFLLPLTWRVGGRTTVNLPGSGWRGGLDPLALVGGLVALLLAAVAWGTRRVRGPDRLKLLAFIAVPGAVAIWAVVRGAPGPLRIAVPAVYELEFRHVVLVMVITLMPLGTAFTFPCVTALLSQVIDPRERGVMMGVQQSFGGAARVLAPLWAGWAWDHVNTAAPFWTSAVLVLGTLFLTFGIQPTPAPVAAPAAD